MEDRDFALHLQHLVEEQFQKAAQLHVELAELEAKLREVRNTAVLEISDFEVRPSLIQTQFNVGEVPVSLRPQTRIYINRYTQNSLKRHTDRYFNETGDSILRKSTSREPLNKYIIDSADVEEGSFGTLVQPA